MRYCVNKIKPNALVHLGDFYVDGETIIQENSHLPFQQVPGNCDRYRCPIGAPETICCSFGGVRFFMTHGHNHHVKSGLGAFLADARRCDAQIALYGHTHKAYCEQLEDGMWVMNPGPCGSWSGSAGVIEIENKTIIACYIVQQADLEEMV